MEAPPGLPPQQTGLHHPGQQRRRRVLGLTKLGVQRLGDGPRGVQADQVRQGQRTERVRTAEHHAAVDVLDGRAARLHHADGGQQIRDEQRVDDEPRFVPGPDDFLAEGAGHEVLGPCRGGGRGEQRRDEFDEAENRYGVEEVHADDAVGAAGRGGEPDDRDGGGVGREDGVLAGDDGVEAGEDVEFQSLVLRHGLDHQVVVAQRLDPVGHRDPGRGGFPLFGAELAVCGGPVEGAGDAVQSRTGRVRIAFHDRDGHAGACADLGDAGAHQAAADHSHPFDVGHPSSSPLCGDPGRPRPPLGRKGPAVAGRGGWRPRPGKRVRRPAGPGRPSRA